MENGKMIYTHTAKVCVTVCKVRVLKFCTKQIYVLSKSD